MGARRVVPGLLLAIGAAVFAGSLAMHWIEIDRMRAGRDFYDYYYTAKAVREQGASVYDHRAMLLLAWRELGVNHAPPYVYPPLLIVLFLPLARLEYQTARVVWVIGNQALLALGVWGLARIWRARTGSPAGVVFALAVALLATGTAPFLDHDWQGQSNLLVLALTTWALAFHLGERRSDLCCGALLAPAVLLKVFPGIFLPYLLVRGAWRAVVWTGVVALAITAATLPFVPVSDYLRFPEVLLGSVYVDEGGPIATNLSLEATGRRLAGLAGLSPEQARAPIAALRFLPLPILLGVAALEARRESSLSGVARLVPALRLAQAFLLPGLVLSRWWIHHLVLLLPGFFLGLRLVSRTGGHGVPALLLAASAGLLAAVCHPLFFPGPLGVRSRAAQGDWLWDLDRLALLLWLAALELAIARLKRPGAGAPAR